MKRFWFILAAFLGLAVQAVPASADMVYSINQNGSAFSPGTFGSISLHEVGSGSTAYVTVTVTLTGGYTFANSGSGYAILWNIQGNPSLTVNNIGPTASDFALQDGAVSGKGYTAGPFASGNCSKAGNSCFDYAIDYVGAQGGQGTDTSLVFDVRNSIAGVFANSFIPNANGYLFTFDVALNGNTGNVAVKAPEPATWLLFFAGLVGLTVLFQRRRQLARVTVSKR